MRYANHTKLATAVIPPQKTDIPKIGLSTRDATPAPAMVTTACIAATRQSIRFSCAPANLRSEWYQ
jgi:hypothetical protein